MVEEVSNVFLIASIILQVNSKFPQCEINSKAQKRFFISTSPVELAEEHGVLSPKKFQGDK
jgi:hypothetical protein